jgi:uncharacterized OsmC-like protein
MTEPEAYSPSREASLRGQYGQSCKGEDLGSCIQDKLDALRSMRDKVKSNPDEAKLKLFTTSKCEGGFKVKSQVSRFELADETKKHANTFSEMADLPSQLGGCDVGAMPIQHLLMSLGESLIINFMKMAVGADVKIKSLSCTVCAKSDLRAELQENFDGPLLRSVKVKFCAEGPDVKQEQLREFANRAKNMSSIAKIIGKTTSVQCCLKGSREEELQGFASGEREKGREDQGERQLRSPEREQGRERQGLGSPDREGIGERGGQGFFGGQYGQGESGRHEEEERYKGLGKEEYGQGQQGEVGKFSFGGQQRQERQGEPFGGQEGRGQEVEVSSGGRQQPGFGQPGQQTKESGSYGSPEREQRGKEGSQGKSFLESMYQGQQKGQEGLMGEGQQRGMGEQCVGSGLQGQREQSGVCPGGEVREQGGKAQGEVDTSSILKSPLGTMLGGEQKGQLGQQSQQGQLGQQGLGKQQGIEQHQDLSSKEKEEVHSGGDPLREAEQSREKQVGESEHISHLLKQDTPEGQSPSKKEHRSKKGKKGQKQQGKESKTELTH